MPMFLLIGGASGPSVDMTDSAAQVCSGGVATFSGLNVGAAKAGRLIVLGIGSQHGTTSNISSVTINGNAVTTHESTSGVQLAYALVSLAVASGTTIDVEVSMSIGNPEVSVVVWALNDLDSHTPVDTTEDNAASATIDLDVATVDDAVVVGFGVVGNTSATVSWTGLTERVDAHGSSSTYSGADAERVTGEALRNISAAFSSGNARGCSGCWR